MRVEFALSSHSEFQQNFANKNAFQWDAYRPLVDRIPACTGQGGGVSQNALARSECLPGGVCLGSVYSGGVCPGGVCPRGCLPGWCLPRGGIYPEVCGRHPPDRPVKTLPLQTSFEGGDCDCSCNCSNQASLTIRTRGRAGKFPVGGRPIGLKQLLTWWWLNSPWAPGHICGVSVMLVVVVVLLFFGSHAGTHQGKWSVSRFGR